MKFRIYRNADNLSYRLKVKYRWWPFWIWDRQPRGPCEYSPIRTFESRQEVEERIGCYKRSNNKSPWCLVEEL